jgi:uncharacterized membrane protein YphA (DoxX/SURF4 family)
MRGAHPIRSAALVAVTTVAIGAATAAPAHAHERWFVENADGGDWGFFFSPLPLVLTAVVAGAAVAWRMAAVRLPTPELKALSPLGRLAPWVPRLVAIHLGVTLLALAATGYLLAPSLPLDDLGSGVGLVVGLFEAGLGIWFISGVKLRPAAAGLAILGPVALLAAGPVAVLETAVLLGVAGVVAVMPPTSDRYGAVEPDPERVRWAVLALRAGAAVSLITLAFSEKFTNPVLAERTLHDYPELNILAAVGLPVSDLTFISIAGSVELLFGLLVLSGALPQVAVLVAAVPFNATLLIFGQTELVGHLPVYAVFLALIVYGSNPRTAAAVRWLPSLSDVKALRPLAARPAQSAA